MADVWISVQAIGGVGSEVEISAQEAKHALGARRLGTGDSVTFFDGFGTTASAEIIDGRSRLRATRTRAARHRADAMSVRDAR